MNSLIVDQMIIIEDEHKRRALSHRGQIVEQHGQDCRERRRLGRVQHPQRSLPDRRHTAAQRGDEAQPEACRMIVLRIQRQPGHLER